MKAIELMVMDYVTVIPSGMPIQVAAVHKRKVAYHACTSKLSCVREGLLRPIPLTPEILEKNGFTFNAEETYSSLQNVYKNFTKFFDFPLGKGFYIEYDTIENVAWITDHCWIRFKYIHEFQHALRLCGIEKEIVL